MIRYRCEINSAVGDSKHEAALRHIARLGKIEAVRGIRYRTRIKSAEGQFYSTTRERVVVKGQYGCASFPSCWGYGGTGPHFTRAILVAAGVPVRDAEVIAFKSKRLDRDGVDWETKPLYEGEWVTALAVV